MTSANQTHAPVLLVVLAYATVYIVWGSTYFFIQKAVHHIPPFSLGALRFLIAGAIMLIWCIIKKEKVFETKYIKPAVITGLFLLFLGNGIVIWVEQTMPSAMVAIMVSSAPVWFVLLDKPRWKENFSNSSTIMGLIAGFSGVVLLFRDQIVASFEAGTRPDWAGLILLTIAGMSWSGGSLYSKYKSSGAPAIVNTTWQMIAAGIAFIPGSFLNNEFEGINWTTIPADAWLSLVYLILMGSIAAFSAYVWLLQVRPATQVSTYAYVNPVIAVLLGVFFANERVSGLQVLGLVIILGSVLLINLARYRKNKRTMKSVS